MRHVQESLRYQPSCGTDFRGFRLGVGRSLIPGSMLLEKFHSYSKTARDGSTETIRLDVKSAVEKQRILIAGSRGFLGRYAIQAATNAGLYQVFTGNRTVGDHPGSVTLDIADAASVDRVFGEVRPSLVLLLAAIADIDRCERAPEEAFAINARGAENVANACARTNARLLFTSTAAVFDGKQHGYREEDPVSPLSTYGKTKVWAEEAVTRLTPSAAIVRFSLAIGFSLDPHQSGMLDTMRTKLIRGETLHLSTREQRNPLEAGSLCASMMRLLVDPMARGLYHTGASDSISRYELGRRLAKRLQLSTDLIQVQDEPIPDRAPRGEDHFLLTEKLQRFYGLEPESCDQTLERCFA
jgi:dTDP-4-dehydrorhamnose reductase